MLTGQVKVSIICMLCEMVRASLQASQEEVHFGHPCSNLIYRMINRKDFLVDSIEASIPGEFPLNGAGLKLFWSTFDGNLTFTVGGDQERFYPTTVPKLREIIKEHGFERVSQVFRG